MRFSRAHIENSVGSSNAVATIVRRLASSRSRTSTPSMVTRPAVTSYSRGTSAVSVVLPEPVAPTTATVSPGATSRFTSRSTGSPGWSGKWKPTPSSRRCPRGSVEYALAGGDRGLGVEDLQDPRRGGHRLLRHREDVAERGDRPHQRQHQGDEGDQRAGGEVAAADADGAEQQHDHDGDVGDDLQEGPELRGQPDLVHRGAVELAGGLLVVLRDVLAAAEGPDHPDADRALLGEGGQVALLVLHLAGDDDVLASRSGWRGT